MTAGLAFAPALAENSMKDGMSKPDAMKSALDKKMMEQKSGGKAKPASGMTDKPGMADKKDTMSDTMKK